MHQEMYVKALTLYLLTWITAAFEPALNFTEMKQTSTSSIFFSINGNVYPKGYYTVAINIGNPPKPYVLDIDTGSDLTWFQCTGKEKVVPCNDPACKSLGTTFRSNGDKCKSPSSPCQYKVSYADGGLYTGTLIWDSLPLKLSNGKAVAPTLAVGCGKPNKNAHSIHQPITDGILGLGKGKPGVLNQLSNMGVIRNTVGHCLSGQGGGFLIFGYVPPSSSGIVWKHISKPAEHYSLGKANILLGGQVTDIKGLNIIFDSGSTYTYLASQAYDALLDLVKRNLKGKLIVAADDKALPICWKGPVNNVANYFLPLALSFTDENNVRFEMPPKSYLVVTNKNNVCFGILNGTEVGLGDMNVIGDISMQDKLVIYDNDNGVVGWAAAKTCNKKP